MNIKIKQRVSAEHLKTHEDIATYLDASFEEVVDNAAFITHAL
jgi:DNA-binding phage protein